jgi:putative serine protease PepD
VPGSWPDDDHEGDGETPLVPPVHPDDRLWRHPSELGWAAAGPTDVAPTAARSGRGPGRPWGLAFASGVLGAAVTLVVLAAFGGMGGEGTRRVVERVGVRTQLADPLDSEPARGLPELVASVSPSVVRLEASTGAGTTSGSGLVVLDDGHVLTNAHVVAGARSVAIVLADGTSVAGEVVGSDPVTDLAVVAPVQGAPPVAWTPVVRGSVEDLRVGDAAVVVAAPASVPGNPTVGLGMVSALRQWVRDGGTTLHGMIESDVEVDAAMSGGAVCDRTGRVVGVATAVGSGDDTGYATAIDEAWRAAESLIADGVVHHVWLGVEGGDVGTTSPSLLGSAGGGVRVERTVPGSPAEAAGLLPGDVITAAGGQPVGSMGDLVLALRAHRPGDQVELSLRRDGVDSSALVTLAERSA